MVRTRENRQKHLISPLGDAGLLRIDFPLERNEMFVCIYDMLQMKENTP
jgi:hypothetical protein